MFINLLNVNSNSLIIIYESSMLQLLLKFFAQKKIFPCKIILFDHLWSDYNLILNEEIDEIGIMFKIVSHYYNQNLVAISEDILKIYNEVLITHRNLPTFKDLENDSFLLKYIDEIFIQFDINLTNARKKQSLLLELSAKYKIFEVGIGIKKKFFSNEIISLGHVVNLYEELNSISLLSCHFVTGYFQERTLIEVYQKDIANLLVVYQNSSILFSQAGNLVMNLLNHILYKTKISFHFFKPGTENLIIEILNSILRFAELADHVKCEENQKYIQLVGNIINKIYAYNMQEYILHLVKNFLSNIFYNPLKSLSLKHIAFMQGQNILISDQGLKTTNLDYLPVNVRKRLNLIDITDVENSINYAILLLIKNNKVIFLGRDINRFSMIFKNLKLENEFKINEDIYILILHSLLLLQQNEYLGLSNIHKISFTAFKILNIDPREFYLNFSLNVKFKSIVENKNAQFGIKLHNLLHLYNQNYNKFKSQKDKLNFLKNNFDEQNKFVNFIEFTRKWIEFDHNRRLNSHKILTEEYLESVVDNVKLYGYIDRLEVKNNNSFCLMDFKTGEVPTQKDINDGIDMQFVAESYCIFRKYNVMPSEILYVKISYNEPYIEIKEIFIKEELFDLLEQSIKILKSKYTNLCNI